ncbi:MAG TPA: helix-turn-helix domain-containing protein [Solirubrobacterales bacterium]|nr:helix-turn-helix domain-containing protein [Solirubrobacterales bacterium]
MAAGKRSGKHPARQRDPEEAFLHVLAHPLRKQLLRLYVEEKGMLSPKELADFTKKHLSSVSYHVRVLAEQGAVEIVAEQQRRGSVEHFYEATGLVDEVPWGRAALGIAQEADR